MDWSERLCLKRNRRDLLVLTVIMEGLEVEKGLQRELSNGSGEQGTYLHGSVGGGVNWGHERQ